MSKQFGQIIDLSQFKKKPEEPTLSSQPVEVKTISDDMIKDNPVIQRAIELQRLDDKVVDPAINMIMSIVHLLLNPGRLKDLDPNEVDGEGNPVMNDRQKFIIDMGNALQALIDREDGAKKDIKYGFMTLGKCMNLLAKVFYNDPAEYMQDMHGVYQISIADAIMPILEKHKTLTTRQFYMIPGNIIEYVAWNDNLDVAASESGLIPPVGQSDTAQDESNVQEQANEVPSCDGDGD